MPIFSNEELRDLKDKLLCNDSDEGLRIFRSEIDRELTSRLQKYEARYFKRPPIGERR